MGCSSVGDRSVSSDNVGVAMGEGREESQVGTSRPKTDPSGSWMKRDADLLGPADASARAVNGAGVMVRDAVARRQKRRPPESDPEMAAPASTPQVSQKRSRAPQTVQAAAVPGARVRRRKSTNEGRQRATGDTCFVMEKDEIPHARVSFSPRRRRCRFRDSSK